MSVVKIGWSGGKDSTCAVLKHIEQGDQVKAVCYIPMFTKEIPMLLRRHYEFITLSANRLREMGAEISSIVYCLEKSRYARIMPTTYLEYGSENKCYFKEGGYLLNFIKAITMFLLIKLASTAYRVCLRMALGGDKASNKSE